MSIHPQTAMAQTLSPPSHSSNQLSAYKPFHAPVYRKKTTKPSRFIVPEGARDDDIELAVFRFTLGIPGFDDRLIPRVVGCIGTSLILINHFLSPQPVSAPQIRTEAIGIALSALAIAAPSIQQRLEELQPGRGRQAPPVSVDGGKNVFSLDKTLPESVQQELAWASYALLKNSNICGMCVVWQDKVLLCRGILGESLLIDTNKNVLKNATDAWNNSCIHDILQRKQGRRNIEEEECYLEDRGQINKQGLDFCTLIPNGVQSMYIASLSNQYEGEELTNKERKNSDSPTTSALVLLSERERSLSRKEQLWAQGVAWKLNAALKP